MNHKTIKSFDGVNAINSWVISNWHLLFKHYGPILTKYNETANIKLTNPFIPYCPNVVSGIKRVGLYLQETYGWGGEFSNGSTVFNPKVSPAELLDLERRYLNDCSYGAVCSPGIRQFLHIEQLAKKAGAMAIFSNLASVGYEYGNKGFDVDINDMFAEYKREEMRTMDYDLVIFQTGPTYDKYIRRWIGEFDLVECLHDTPTNELAKLVFTSGPLVGKECYRAYHPQALISKADWAMAIKDFIDNKITALKEPLTPANHE